MSALLIGYALASAYASEGIKKEQKQKAESQNKIYEFGRVKDDSGKLTGGLVSRGDVVPENMSNFVPEYFRVGTEGQLREYKKEPTIEPAYFDTQNKMMGKLNDFPELQRQNVTNPADRQMPLHIVNTGQYVDGAYNGFPSDVLKMILPDDDEPVETTFENVGQTYLAADGAEFKEYMGLKNHLIENPDIDSKYEVVRTTETMLGNTLTKRIFNRTTFDYNRKEPAEVTIDEPQDATFTTPDNRAHKTYADMAAHLDANLDLPRTYFYDVPTVTTKGDDKTTKFTRTKFKYEPDAKPIEVTEGLESTLIASDGSEHKDANAINAYYKDNPGLERTYQLRTKSITKKPDETTTTFEFGEIRTLKDAAEKADKVALFSIEGKDPANTFNFELTSQTKTLTPATLTALNTEVARLGISGVDDVANRYNEISYQNFLGSVAESVVQAYTDVDKDGIKIGIPFRLYNDVERYMKESYGALAALPGFINVLQANVDLKRREDYSEQIATNEAQGKKTIIATLDSNDNPNIPQGQSLDLLVGVSEEHKLIIDQLGQKISGVDMEDFAVKNLLTYVPGTGGAQLADNQDKLEFLGDMMNTSVAGTNQTQFDLFIGALTGVTADYEGPTKELMENFVEGYGSTFDEKVSFISRLSARLGGDAYITQQYKAYNNNRRETPETTQKFVEGQLQVFAAYSNVERFLTGFINTYELYTGQDINIPSRQGEIYLTFDGLLVAYDNVIKPALQKIPLVGEFIKDSQGSIQSADDTLNTVQTALFSKDNNGTYQGFTKFSDLSRPEQEKWMRDNGKAGTVEDYLKGEVEANAKLKSQLNKFSRTGFDEKGEISFKLAMRAYYRYMAAYALASATQGGTGGRTISDQDVANFLTAFQQEKLLSNPANEKRVLQQILKEVKVQKKIAQNLSGGGINSTPESRRTAVATLKLLRMPGSQYIGNGMDVLSEKTDVGGFGEQKGAAEQVDSKERAFAILNRLVDYEVENTPTGDRLVQTDDPAENSLEFNRDNSEEVLTRLLDQDYTGLSQMIGEYDDELDLKKELGTQ